MADVKLLRLIELLELKLEIAGRKLKSQELLYENAHDRFNDVQDLMRMIPVAYVVLQNYVITKKRSFDLFNKQHEERQASIAKFVDQLKTIQKEFEAENQQEAEAAIVLVNDEESNPDITDVFDYHLLHVNKLMHVNDGNQWKLTFESGGESTTLVLKEERDGHNMYIDGKIVSKKLVLDGILEQEKDIDRFKEGFTSESLRYEPYVSRLLKNYVASCNLTDLFLYNQKMSWADYQILIDGENLESLYFSNVSIEKPNGTFVSIENILKPLPMIEKFGCSFGLPSSIQLTRRTFDKLPDFKNLQKFLLYDVTLDTFDADSFIKFTKKHPKANFTLIFRYGELPDNEKKQVKETAKKLRENVPNSDRLVIYRK